MSDAIRQGTKQQKALRGAAARSAAGEKLGGRPKNVPNKSTIAAREAIARFVDGNAERLQEWLDQIAEIDGPKDAFRCLMDVMEYHVPKLARTEITGKDGGDLFAPDQVLVMAEAIKRAKKMEELSQPTQKAD